MRSVVNALFFLTVWLSIQVDSLLMAQDGEVSLGQRINQGLSSSSRDGGASGGGAIANYNDLVRLIENTIDADWQANGGTANMIPYRNGVRIDPTGVIERFDPAKDKLPILRVPKKGSKETNAIAHLDKLGDWQQPSELRWISLHQLDRQIASRLNGDVAKPANVSMELLAGLYRIDYLAFDRESQEWLIGGPAGKIDLKRNGDICNAETGLPPVLLEDLLCIAPHVLGGHGEFGCTIDPDVKRLAESHAMAQTPASIRGLQRQPDKWVEQWRQKLGRQYAKVIGIRQDSPTGYALLIADAHMKRLGLELESCPSPMKSYWQERELFGSSNRGAGLVRWWFALTDHKIPMDPDRHVYHFASSNVQVMSEAQMMNSKGERVVADNPDIAADAFAKGFTRNFETLQRTYPVYGRLRHIFDLAVALEIVRSEIQRGNGKPFEALNDMAIQPRLETAPLEIDTVAAIHKNPEGSTSAIVSGGVSIHLGDVRKRLTTDRSKTNKVDVTHSNDPSKQSDAPIEWASDHFWR